MGAAGKLARSPCYANAVDHVKYARMPATDALLGEAASIGMSPFASAQNRNHNAGSNYAPDREMLSIDPLTTKAAAKIARALEQIPMRMAAKILRIAFVVKYAAGTHDQTQVFVVTYANNATLEFGDIDMFPTDADIARIALECP